MSSRAPWCPGRVWTVAMPGGITHACVPWLSRSAWAPSWCWLCPLSCRPLGNGPLPHAWRSPRSRRGQRAPRGSSSCGPGGTDRPLRVAGLRKLPSATRSPVFGSVGVRPVRAGYRRGYSKVPTDASQPEQCPVCEGPMVQNTGAGRRRRYCSTACRRRAQRNRQAGKAPVVAMQGPMGAAVAAEVRRLAQQLLDSEMRQEELGTLLERAEAIRRELDIYTAAAVQDARHRGEKWESVARAAHVAPETA